MNWLFRFFLGLTARPADIEAMRQDVPELFTDTADFESLLRTVRQTLPLLRYHPSELARELRAWITRAPQGDDRLPVLREVDEDGLCVKCPRRDGTSDLTPDENPDTQPSRGGLQNSQALDQGIYHLMAVGGGPDQKEPLHSFLDLVRRVHRDRGHVKKIIVTDPYILARQSEDGSHGGFENFCKYIDCFELKSTELLITPGPKDKTDEHFANWEREIRNRYPLVKNVGRHATGATFHDRFYIVQHEKDDVCGVFGPSMTGLGTNSVILFGEIEKDAIKRLAQILRLP